MCFVYDDKKKKNSHTDAHKECVFYCIKEKNKTESKKYENNKILTLNEF